VNTGVLWPELEGAEVQVLRIQTKLHQWATGDPGRRFDDLFNLVVDPAVLVVAWARVRVIEEAVSGVDRVKPVSIVAAEGWFLPALREDLKAREFTPMPVRERMIPKPGTSKRRRLGIPPRGTAPCKRPSSWCSSRSSRRISSHAPMASARGAEPRTHRRDPPVRVPLL
jgi:RNA-directed DNA polymerase